MRLCFALSLAALLSACAGTRPPTELFIEPRDVEAVNAAVRAVLDAQVAAWNTGDIRGYMAGYARTDSLVFLSGTDVRIGWETALTAYLRGYPGPEAMGLLAFDDLRVQPLSAGHALAWGRWSLRRDGPLDAQPAGLFTLLFARTPAGWRIVHDHTSGG